jgi:hypothetical protein
MDGWIFFVRFFRGLVTQEKPKKQGPPPLAAKTRPASLSKPPVMRTCFVLLAVLAVLLSICAFFLRGAGMDGGSARACPHGRFDACLSLSSAPHYPTPNPLHTLRSRPAD